MRGRQREGRQECPERRVAPSYVGGQKQGVPQLTPPLRLQRDDDMDVWHADT